MSAAFLKFAERVNKPGFHKCAKPGAFFRSETVVVNIGFGIGKIHFRVRHIEVTAKNHGLFLFQLFKVTQKISVPTLAVSEAERSRLELGT